MKEDPALPCDQRAAALANQVEGYLLLQAEWDRAQREAEQLCASLPWLTTGQAEDLTRHYTQQRLALTRRLLHATADRALELRQEYQARYDLLRRRLLKRHTACAALLLGGVGAAGSVTYLLAR